MSSSVKLASSLPTHDELNGLRFLANDIVESPDELVVAVVVLGTQKLTTDVETGDVVPTTRVRRVEPITNDEDRARLGNIATRALERRTGKTVLPLDLEDELREAFGATTKENPGEEGDA